MVMMINYCNRRFIYIELGYSMIENKPSASHDYHNSVQALTLIVDAKKRGLAKLVATGMSNLDDLEKDTRL